MKLFKFAGGGVGVGGGESPSPIGWERVAGRPGEEQPPHNVQHIQRPVPKAFGIDWRKFS
jgi:hypothetical protein